MLSVFHGQASNAEARIYAQYDLADLKDLAGVSLSGTVYGPQSKLARTLPAKIAFRNLEPGETVLAEAIVPDPCFWTPESPYTYTIDVVVENDGQQLQHLEQVFGICPLGTRAKHLYLDGVRWVLRGGKSAELNADNITQLREAVIAGVVSCDKEVALLSAASEQGVFVVGWLSAESDESKAEEGDLQTETAEVLARLNSLAAWPAVGMVVIDTAVDEAMLTEKRPRNLLLGERLQVNETNPEFQPSAWANFVVGDVSDSALFVAQTSHLEIPVIAYRETDAELSATEVRAACEKLQQELSKYGDFAGYLV